MFYSLPDDKRVNTSMGQWSQTGFDLDSFNHIYLPQMPLLHGNQSFIECNQGLCIVCLYSACHVACGTSHSTKACNSKKVACRWDFELLKDTQYVGLADELHGVWEYWIGMALFIFVWYNSKHIPKYIRYTRICLITPTYFSKAKTTSVYKAITFIPRCWPHEPCYRGNYTTILTPKPTL